MYELRPVQMDDEAKVLHFELENRAYFAASISDRGDDYFENFPARHRELLREQTAGANAYYLFVDDDQRVVGRFNLYGLVDETADVGYRVAERFSGRGVATRGLGELCRVASGTHALRTLRASARDDNRASQRVLVKAGFVVIGTAELASGRGVRYERTLERQ
ncbi:MAG: GNAT family N-acetyltransferase [Acidimicrobiales bacterium]